MTQMGDNDRAADNKYDIHGPWAFCVILCGPSSPSSLPSPTLNPTPEPGPLKDKKEFLRQRCKTYRKRLTDAQYALQSRAICQTLASLPEIQTARTLHAYWPRCPDREIDLRPLLLELQAQNKQIFLPVVVNFNLDKSLSPRMRQGLFTTSEALRLNRWGIHEPTGFQSVPRTRIDAILVPALCAGRNGHRIGYGRGYYDEFLAGLDTPLICAVYHPCLFDDVPAGPLDVPMTHIVTEDEVLNFSAL